MKFVIQRVSEASVTVDHQVIGRIHKGLMVLVGISADDNKTIADKMIRKLIGLRIFQDENGKTNLDIKTIGGELLIISQFTLYADCRRGNRPSFTKAGEPLMAEELYEYILSESEKEVTVKKGAFGADMAVALVNDGPFTVVLDSEEMGI